MAPDSTDTFSPWRDIRPAMPTTARSRKVAINTSRSVVTALIAERNSAGLTLSFSAHTPNSFSARPCINDSGSSAIRPSTSGRTAMGLIGASSDSKSSAVAVFSTAAKTSFVLTSDDVAAEFSISLSNASAPAISDSHASYSTSGT